MSRPLRDPLTRAGAVPGSDSLTGELALKIENLLAGVQSQAWAVSLRDRDRSLRAGNHPETTRYNHMLAASQPAAYLGERMPEAGGACDPPLVDSRQVTAFQAAVIEQRSAGTGLNKYKALQQFFRWLVIEGEVERSPMHGVPHLLVPDVDLDTDSVVLTGKGGKQRRVRFGPRLRVLCAGMCVPAADARA
ncbi:hypothetical protein [Actinoplanes sp. NBRC 103695]|uniref:hypothetical protein n=1 Tax=Actinoplanes sp. NBRC 103695 TaxID=3032202 RepID=UPI0024A0D306|nr:hypothetical protein [Actinoplanes sp. NBRC 103695]GLY99516.1 hypothetical protein Acsp02_67690 [Actinoplanes sp. NBRC 103695]